MLGKNNEILSIENKRHVTISSHKKYYIDNLDCPKHLSI
jgi:hypothetical protein